MRIKSICFFLLLLTFSACQQKKNILSCYISSIRPYGVGVRCSSWQGDLKLNAIIRNDNDKTIYFPLSIAVKEEEEKNESLPTLSFWYKGKPLEHISLLMLEDSCSIPPHKSATLEILVAKGVKNPSIVSTAGEQKKLKIKDFKIRYHVEDPALFTRDNLCDSLTFITYPSIVHDESVLIDSVYPLK
jgi:hypothetical protein